MMMMMMMLMMTTTTMTTTYVKPKLVAYINLKNITFCIGCTLRDESTEDQQN